ncbi:hypothetical protein AAFF_G00139950 [Aldrovandia affinis]|uniref:Triacylglycerol lipase n=1 Tax=Aldrovandia affinis TaxID=143900 RepID=A0AAD7X234_9TELE|nr:hypothetical protein AAFF_G00139950 [Aldrovandia affinis]
MRIFQVAPFKMFLVWILGLFLLGIASGAEVCYDNLGCFSDDIPWAGTVERPIARLPWTPEEIGTRFLLYTQQNPNNHQASRRETPGN